ncbi:hypothetical protein [Butyrivibrio hungatei]|nr:hypothetical protein [Butyrivibrio hungatei]
MPKKWCWRKRNMPSENEKFGMRHTICCGSNAEGRKICLKRRKSLR